QRERERGIGIKREGRGWEVEGGRWWKRNGADEGKGTQTEGEGGRRGIVRWKEGEREGEEGRVKKREGEGRRGIDREICGKGGKSKERQGEGGIRK
ncbi:hypothetical protein LSAT2_032933, partial [Lamellibrachia satsuma]